MRTLKTLIFLALLALLAGLAHGADMSIALATDDEETTKAIQEALAVWALEPTSATACSGECCLGAATDAECNALASQVLGGQSEDIARGIFPCIQASSVAFACNWWTDKDGKNRMVCETFPSAIQALVDSATCASKLAATRF